MLRYIRLTNPDISLYLNGGGTVYTPRGEAVPRERIEEEWRLWKECIAAEVPDVTMMSCLGDDDLRWAGEAEDPLRGKPYVQRQLETPSTYYSFTRNGWLFCMLDSNHANGSLGEEQMAWLKTELEHSRNLPVLVVSHYPLVAFSTIPDRSGIHQDWEEIIALFNANPNVKLCLSGHTHLLDRVWYNGVKYCCNGSASGYWWEAGDDGKSSYKQTPPGYALVDLFADGRSRCEYIPFPHGSISDNAF
jgi:3',5'-cyclic AMP phosphodiesterase CpdA